MSKSKKYISFFIIITLLTTLIPVSDNNAIICAPQVRAAMEGTCGQDVYWELEENGKTDKEGMPFYTLHIYGTGDMTDYDSSNNTAPWKVNADHIEDVDIESGVTSIGSCAFYKHISLINVSLPETVTRIGKYAFYRCRYLSSIALPDNLTVLGYMAFCATSLTSIELPESLTTIGYEAFCSTNIKEIFISKNVTSIGITPFAYCYSLASIIVDDDNTHYRAIDNVLYELKDGKPCKLMDYAHKAFSYDDILTLPDGLQRINNDGLQDIKCQEVILPEGLNYIGQNAFSGAAIRRLDIPDSLETFGNVHPFQSCYKLKDITIGKGLTSVVGAFRNCINIENITIHPENNHLVCIDKVIYSKDMTELQFYIPKKEDETFEMPDSVTTIGSYSIFGVANLKRLIISEGCTNLTSCDVYIPHEVIASNKKLIAIYFKGEPFAYKNYNYKADYYISGNNEKLIIYYPSGSTGYTTDKWSSFNMAEWAPTAHYDSTSGDIDDNIHWDYEGRTGLLTLKGAGSTGDYSSDNPAPWSSFINKINEVETEGISGLGAGIFTNAAKLKRIITDDSLSSIGDSALENCPGLLYADVATASTIGEAAFKGDTSLNDGIYFQKLQTAGANAFNGCSSMTTITLGNSIEIIPEGMFRDCSSLVMTMIPESVTRIEEQAYRGCTSLYSINIPASVEYIGNKAFADNTGLEKMYYYGGIPEIEADCFDSHSDKLMLYYRSGHSEWASQGNTYMELPVQGLSRFYTERKDHYSFSNSASSFGYAKGYKIPKNRYLTLLKRTKSIYYSALNTEWGGSCFGMTGTTLEFYENTDSYKVSAYDSTADSLYDISAPQSPDSPLTELIELYQIAQFTPAVAGYRGETAHHLNDYSGLIRKIEEFERSGGLSVDSAAEPVIMLIYSPFGGHAVIPVSVDPVNDGTYDVTVYDPNYPDRFRTIKINKNLKSISYGWYYAASYLSYEVLRDTLANSEQTRNTSDDSLYMSVNKGSGTVNSSDGKPVSKIEGAYEQKFFTGNDDTQNEASEEVSLRSYVVPEGDYLIGKSEALEPDDGNNPDDSSGNNTNTEPISFFVASDDMYASVEISDPDTVLEVNDSDTEDNSVELTIRTEDENAEADITIANSNGIERDIHISGGSSGIIMSNGTDITVKSVDNSDINANSGSKKLTLNNGEAYITLQSGSDENPYRINEFLSDVSVEDYCHLQGNIDINVNNNSSSDKAVDIKVTYTDINNHKIAEFSKSTTLTPGINALEYDYSGINADYALNSGNTVISSTLTVSDNTGNTTTYSGDEQTITVPEPIVEPTVAPTVEPTVAPTNEPTVTPTAAPTTEPTVTPTAAPTTEPTVAPTNEPVAAHTTEPTVAPTNEPVATHTTEPTVAPTNEPTAAPASTPATNPSSAPSAAPDVTNRIYINTGSFWTTLLKILTFGIYSPSVTVTIDSSLEDLADIYYYVDRSGSTSPLTAEELDNIRTWNRYTGIFPLDNANNVVYARIVNNESGDVYYICSDGIYCTATQAPAATPELTATPVATASPAASAMPTAAPSPAGTVTNTTIPAGSNTTTAQNIPAAISAAPATADTAPAGAKVVSTGSAYKTLTIASIKKGKTIYRAGKLKYTIKSKKNKTVSVYGVTKKNIKTIIIPDKVKINNITYKVTTIRANAFAGLKKAETVIIGKNIRTIGKRAFANCTGIKYVLRKSGNIKEGKDVWKGVNI